MLKSYFSAGNRDPWDRPKNILPFEAPQNSGKFLNPGVQKCTQNGHLSEANRLQNPLNSLLFDLRHAEGAPGKHQVLEPSKKRKPEEILIFHKTNVVVDKLETSSGILVKFKFQISEVLLRRQ